jgi:hypothetical protein
MRTTNSKTKTALQRSSLLALAVATAVMIAIPMGAQQTAFATGGMGVAKVRASIGLTMPVLMHFTPSTQPIATWQGERFTEYVIRYSVATNSRWDVSVSDLPQGVTVLAEDGGWVDGRSGQVIVARGQPTNPIEVLVRLRIADGTSAAWHSELTIAASRTGF